MANVKFAQITNAQALAVATDVLTALARTDNGAQAIRQALAQNDVKVSEVAFIDKLTKMSNKAHEAKKSGKSDASVENSALALVVVEKMHKEGARSITARQVVGIKGVMNTQKASAVMRQGVKDGLFTSEKGENMSAVVYSLME